MNISFKTKFCKNITDLLCGNCQQIGLQKPNYICVIIEELRTWPEESYNKYAGQAFLKYYNFNEDLLCGNCQQCNQRNLQNTMYKLIAKLRCWYLKMCLLTNVGCNATFLNIHRTYCEEMFVQTDIRTDIWLLLKIFCRIQLNNGAETLFTFYSR